MSKFNYHKQNRIMLELLNLGLALATIIHLIGAMIGVKFPALAWQMVPFNFVIMYVIQKISKIKRELKLDDLLPLIIPSGLIFAAASVFIRVGGFI